VDHLSCGPFCGPFILRTIYLADHLSCGPSILWTILWTIYFADHLSCGPCCGQIMSNLTFWAGNFAQRVQNNLIHINTDKAAAQFIAHSDRHTTMSDCQSQCLSYCGTATDYTTPASMSECTGGCFTMNETQCEAFMKGKPVLPSSSTSTYSTSATAAFSNKSGKQSSSQGSCSL